MYTPSVRLDFVRPTRSHPVWTWNSSHLPCVWYSQPCRTWFDTGTQIPHDDWRICRWIETDDTNSTPFTVHRRKYDSWQGDPKPEGEMSDGRSRPPLELFLIPHSTGDISLPTSEKGPVRDLEASCKRPRPPHGKWRTQSFEKYNYLCTEENDGRGGGWHISRLLGNRRKSVLKIQRYLHPWFSERHRMWWRSTNLGGPHWKINLKWGHCNHREKRLTNVFNRYHSGK